MKTMQTAPPARTQAPAFAVLAGRLAERGFAPGAPEHIREETRQSDRAVCRSMKCPGCKGRGLAYRPYHAAGGRYAVLAKCERCPAAEVL